MRTFTLILALVCLSVNFAFAKVTILNKKEGKIRLTQEDSRDMLKVILKLPVKVSDDSYTLTLKTEGQDFNYRRKTFITGSVVCKRDGSRCIVDGTEARTSRDGWFAPEVGFVRVFGLGNLSAVSGGSRFSCGAVYANIACDFEL